MRWPWRNDIINGLDALNSEMLMPHLHRVSLSRGEVIESSGDCISSVYFPETAVLSLTAAPEAGKCSDVAFVGFEGMSGVSLAGKQTGCLQQSHANFRNGNRNPSGRIRIRSLWCA